MERLRPDDLEDPNNRWKPAIQLHARNRRSRWSAALCFDVRPTTSVCWRRTAFSASSRAVHLNGETKRAKANHRDPITRSGYADLPPPQWNEVFGTHRTKTIGRSQCSGCLHESIENLERTPASLRCVAPSVASPTACSRTVPCGACGSEVRHIQPVARYDLLVRVRNP